MTEYTPVWVTDSDGKHYAVTESSAVIHKGTNVAGEIDRIDSTLDKKVEFLIDGTIDASAPSDSVAGLVGNVAMLETKTNDLETSVATATNNINTLDNAVNALNNDVSGVKTSINGINDSITSLNQSADASKVTTSVITILASQWEIDYPMEAISEDNNIQTASSNDDIHYFAMVEDVPGVTWDNTVIVSPHVNFIKEYTDIGCYCSMQAKNTLYFYSNTIPKNDIKVNVLALGV